MFKLTTGIITCLPEKEKSHQKNNIVYALNAEMGTRYFKSSAALATATSPKK